MKNNLPESNSQNIPLDIEWDMPEDIQENVNFSSKDYNTMMTEQFVMPPSRVWDKIEQILDEQDIRRKRANDLILTAFEPFKAKRKKMYIAAVAAASLAVGIVWKFS